MQAADVVNINSHVVVFLRVWVGSCEQSLKQLMVLFPTHWSIRQAEEEPPPGASTHIKASVQPQRTICPVLISVETQQLFQS